MPRSAFPTVWALFAAAILLAVGPLLRGDDDALPDSDVHVKSAHPPKAKPAFIKVQDQPNPYRNVTSSQTPDKYRPDQPDYSKVSTLANKQFSSSSSSLTQKNTGLTDQTFLTKPYFGKGTVQADGSTPNLNAKITPAPSTDIFHRSASGVNQFRNL